MSKLFRASDPLILPQPLAMDGDRKFKKTGPVDIKAFVDNTFIAPSSPEETHVKSAIDLARNYNCTYDEYSAFLWRFIGLVNSRIEDICNCVCENRNIWPGQNSLSLRDNIRKIVEMFEYSALQMTESRYSQSPKYVVYPEEHDFTFHFANILGYLSHPIHNNKQHGLIVLCFCQSVMEPLFLLTNIISQSSPPKHLYSFIPMSVQNTSISLSTNLLTLVSDPCDLEATTRSIISSVCSGSCISHWMPSVILVQESICSRLINRINQILGNQHEIPGECSVDDSTKLLLTSSGASLVAVHEVPYSSFIVYNTVPSLVDQFCSNRGLVFILPFRTAKEALEIVSHHLSNQKYGDPNKWSIINRDTVVSMWSHDQNVVWQMFQALASFNIDAVYVNTSNEDFLRNEYMRTFKSSRKYSSDLMNTTTNFRNFCPKRMTEIFLSVTKAQESLMHKNLKLIHRELLKIETDLGSNVLFDVYKSYNNHVEKLLGNLTNSQFDFNGLSHLKLGGIHLRPSGPVVIVVDQSQTSIQAIILHILRLIFCALFASNSVILMTYSSKKIETSSESPFSIMISNIQNQLTDKSLISLCETDLKTSDDVENLVRTAFRSDVVIQIQKSDHDLEAGHVTSLVRPVCMYWSTGQNIFA